MLMATIIKGMLAQKLPWGPVLVGVCLAFVAQLAGAHALSWAVGAYLPISTTAPIWIGGLPEPRADRQAEKPPQGRTRARLLHAPRRVPRRRPGRTANPLVQRLARGPE